MIDDRDDRPGEAARARLSAEAGRKLPRRFYTDVTLAPVPNGVRVLLDGRGAKTPRKADLIAPNVALGDVVRREWMAQSSLIDPASMPMTTLVCTAIDVVSVQRHAIADEIARYAASDLLCYRAEAPTELVAAQARHWDPVLAWAERDLGARFVIATGLMPVAQPPQAAAAVGGVIATLEPVPLAAVHVLTTLTGSALLSVAILRKALTLDEAWAAAHVDEDWQIAQWGHDGEAESRRVRRLREARAAALVLALT